MPRPDTRVLDLFGITHPILLAPMAGPGTAELAIAVSKAGGLGSLACAMLSVPETRQAVETVRAHTTGPLNLNFFCHEAPAPDPAREAAWRARLAPFAAEFGLDTRDASAAPSRRPFEAEACALVEDLRPEVVSFHFGLPPAPLLARVKATGAKVISSATTTAEARWLVARGCDAVIAMGLEAGGHRAAFLDLDMARQVGTFALVPQIVDAVRVPVIAAGGIADARGIVAALALGAAAVQIGTAYLVTPEARVSPSWRAALATAEADATVLTNVFTGRPARGIINRAVAELGPLAKDAPPFPVAAAEMAPLRAAAEAAGSSDFTNLWAGQSARLARPLPAQELTRTLAAEALVRLSGRA